MIRFLFFLVDSPPFVPRAGRTPPTADLQATTTSA